MKQMSDKISEFESEDDVCSAGAYLDREMDPQQRTGFETQLFTDARLRALYRALGYNDARLKDELGAVLDLPVPAALRTAIDREFAARHARTSRGMASLHWKQVAAVVAIVVGSVAVAGAWIGRNIDGAVSELAATLEADRQTLSGAVAKALETNRSGVSEAWAGAGGSGGTITPVNTYRSVSGHWCREYLQEIRLGGEDVKVRGLACRSDSGEWITLRAGPASDGMSGKGA